MVKKSLFISLLISTSSADAAMAQAVYTEFCARTVQGNGTYSTDDDVYVVLTGYGGEKTREFQLDAPGVDANESHLRDGWTCGGHSNTEVYSVRDVGFHVIADVRLDGGDDWCMHQAYSRRWRGSNSSARNDAANLISTSGFLAVDPARKDCFGDTASLGSEPSRSLPWARS